MADARRPNNDRIEALEVKNKTVEKILSSDVTSLGVVSDLTVTGLTVGKRYELKYHMRVDVLGGQEDIEIAFKDSGGTVYGPFAVITGASGLLLLVQSGALEFTAVGSTFQVEVTAYNASARLAGDGSKVQTFIQVTELNNTEEVSSFT